MRTSISLPHNLASLWRRNRKAIMKIAVRSLRMRMRLEGIRRGVTRRYNRRGRDFCIVMTRFTAAEYDTLHYAAYVMRVSVSLLIYWMIQLWLKPARRMNNYVSNLEFYLTYWGKNGGFYAESLMFWPKFWKSEMVYAKESILLAAPQ